MEGSSPRRGRPGTRAASADRLVKSSRWSSASFDAGVSRSKHRGERLRGRVAPGAEGVEPKAVLVGRGGVLLV